MWNSWDWDRALLIKLGSRIKCSAIRLRTAGSYRRANAADYGRCYSGCIRRAPGNDWQNFLTLGLSPTEEFTSKLYETGRLFCEGSNPAALRSPRTSALGTVIMPFLAPPSQFIPSEFKKIREIVPADTMSSASNRVADSRVGRPTVSGSGW
jgi:hypothetical protein